ncbi:MAG: T9SS type A sorting domain-containing protein, partial [Bacteroidetes bacterium]|nr:T9SS type A sorting domain-containing protein [Bacteroidota bacterium]
GLIDEDGGVTWYEDADGDGFGNPNVSQVSCTQPSGYVTNNTDCDDTKLLYADNDGDGYGAGSPVACGVDNNTDCNDDDASVHPDAIEICGNGIDDNCNGLVDEACTENNPIGISINDKSIREGNDGNRLMIFYVKLSKASRRIVKVQYATQNGTAEAGSDYQASSGQLTFLPGVKRMPVAVIINSDIIPETDETMTVVLSNPVNAVITDGTGVGTIRNDDIAPVASASEESVMTASAIKYARIMPNPAQTFVKVELTGYSGQVVLELSDLYGRKLHQQKVQVGKAKVYSQQINLTNYANGNYLIRVIDENGKYQTLQLVIAR